jgi:hypothetical protein
MSVWVRDTNYADQFIMAVCIFSLLYLSLAIFKLQKTYLEAKWG